MNSLNDPMSIFAAIMAVAVLAPFLSDTIGIPVVASATLVGILLGPQALGLIQPTLFLQYLGSAGLVYAFFLAGSETSLSSVLKNPKKTLVFGALTFCIPFAAGFAAAYFALRLDTAPSILVGAFFASSGSLSSRLFAREHSSERESVGVGRSGAGLSRLLTVFVLFLTGLHVPGSGWSATLAWLALQLLFFAGLFLLLPKLAALVTRSARPLGSAESAFVLFLLFASSALAPLAGVASHIAAFFAGVALAPHIAVTKSAPEKFGFLGETLFLPFLLVFLGATADFTAAAPLALYGALLVGAALAAIGSKFAASAIASLLLKYAKADRALLFGFSSSFAAFSLAVAAVAVNTGFLSHPFLSGAVVLVILSSAIASIIARSSNSSIAARRNQGISKPEAGARRLIVALSKPGTARTLMETALLFTGKLGGATLYPTVIVPDTDPESEAGKRAETMLAAAVMQGASGGVSVIPISGVSANVSQGIADAAETYHVDTVLIGWHKAPRLSNAFFGSVIDQAIADSSRTVVVARSVAPVKPGPLVIVAPTLCEKHPGFAQAVGLIESFAVRGQMKPHLLTLSASADEELKAFKAAGLGGSVKPIGIESWKEAVQGIRSLQAPPRAIFILCSRPSEPSWHPAIERMPHRLGEELPDANILTVYMRSEASSQAAIQAELFARPDVQAGLQEAAAAAESARETIFADSRRILERSVARGNVRVNMAHAAIADGIFELVSSAFPFDRRQASRLGTKFTESVQRQPIELEPGVILIHERLKDIDSPILCLGARREGFRLALLQKSVHILVIIFVPETQGAEEHLAFLGAVAHMFKEERLASKLLEASAPDQILGIRDRP